MGGGVGMGNLVVGRGLVYTLILWIGFMKHMMNEIIHIPSHRREIQVAILVLEGFEGVEMEIIWRVQIFKG